MTLTTTQTRTDMSADKHRGIRRQKQKRAKQPKKQAEHHKPADSGTAAKPE
jgi:hypothetical protein